MFEEELGDRPLTDVLKKTFLSAFTFLMAFSIRDVFTKTILRSVPENSDNSLIFTYLFALFVIFITLLMVFIFY